MHKLMLHCSFGGRTRANRCGDPCSPLLNLAGRDGSRHWVTMLGGDWINDLLMSHSALNRATQE